MLSISVVLCAYTEQRWPDLVSAIQALNCQTRCPEEIIVVIDHNPQLYQRASEAFPDVRVIQNEHERGLSGARNTGIAYAAYDVIAFIDEDAEAEPIWLETLMLHYQNPAVVGVGGQIVPQWVNTPPRWFPSEFHWVVGCTYRGMPEIASNVRNLIGCNMSFRRQVFRDIGLFREGIGRIDTLPVGCEETEFCIRINQKWTESQLLYEPRAIVHHHVPGIRANWRYFVSRCYSEGLSKAQIARYIGSKDALSNERTYTLKTLPSGVLRGLADVLRGDLSGLGRATAIVAGFGITGVGYVVGKLRHLGKAHPLAVQVSTELP